MPKLHQIYIAYDVAYQGGNLKIISDYLLSQPSAADIARPSVRRSPPRGATAPEYILYYYISSLYP